MSSSRNSHTLSPGLKVYLLVPLALSIIFAGLVPLMRAIVARPGSVECDGRQVYEAGSLCDGSGVSGVLLGLQAVLEGRPRALTLTNVLLLLLGLGGIVLAALHIARRTRILPSG